MADRGPRTSAPAASCAARAACGAASGSPGRCSASAINELGLRLHPLGGASTSTRPRRPTPRLPTPSGSPYYLLLLARARGVLMKAERPHIPATAWLDALIPRLRGERGREPAAPPPRVDSGQAGRPSRSCCSPTRHSTCCSWWSTVLFLALRRWEPDTRWGLLALAVLGSALGDTLWSYLVAAGTLPRRARRPISPTCSRRSRSRWAAWAPKTPDAGAGARTTGSRCCCLAWLRCARSGCSCTARSAGT